MHAPSCTCRASQQRTEWQQAEASKRSAKASIDNFTAGALQAAVAASTGQACPPVEVHREQPQPDNGSGSFWHVPIEWTDEGDTVYVSMPLDALGAASASQVAVEFTVEAVTVATHGQVQVHIVFPGPTVRSDSLWTCEGTQVLLMVKKSLAHIPWIALGERVGSGKASADTDVQAAHQASLATQEGTALAQPPAYTASITLDPEDALHLGDTVRVRFAVNAASLSSSSLAGRVVGSACGPLEVPDDAVYDSDDGSPSDRDFLGIYSYEGKVTPQSMVRAVGRHWAMEWLPMPPSGDGRRAWRHAANAANPTSQAEALLTGSVPLRLPGKPGVYQVRLVTRRRQVAGVSEPFSLPTTEPKQPMGPAVPPPLPADVQQHVDLVRRRQEEEQLGQELSRRQACAVDAGTVATSATAGTVASLGAPTALSAASHDTAATSAFAALALKRLLGSSSASGAHTHLRSATKAALTGGGPPLLRPPFALQQAQHIGITTLYLQLPSAAGWAPGTPCLHVSPAGLASVLLPCTRRGEAVPGVLLLWEAELGCAVRSHKHSFSHDCLVWRLHMDTTPHMTMYKPPAVVPLPQLSREEACLRNHAGVLECAWCGAQLSQAAVGRVRRAPSETWTAWMDHWLCHTEERGHLLPTQDVTPDPKGALLGDTHVMLHPAAAAPGALRVRWGQRALPRELPKAVAVRWGTMAAGAAAASGRPDATSAAAEPAQLHCARCDAEVGDTFIVPLREGQVAGECGVQQAFPAAVCLPALPSIDTPQPTLNLAKAQTSFVVPWATAHPATAPTPERVAEDSEGTDASLAAAGVPVYHWYLRHNSPLSSIKWDVFGAYLPLVDTMRRLLAASAAEGAFTFVFEAPAPCPSLHVKLAGWNVKGMAAGQPLLLAPLEGGAFLRMEPCLEPAARRKLAAIYPPPALPGSIGVTGALQVHGSLVAVKWRLQEGDESAQVGSVQVPVSRQQWQELQQDLASLSRSLPAALAATAVAPWNLSWVPLHGVVGK